MGKNTLWSTIWKSFISKRLAAILIFALAVISTVGMIVPGSAVFQTRWFAAIGIVFLVNLTACTVEQAIRAYRLWRKHLFGPGVWGAPLFHAGLILIAAGALVSGAMKMTGYLKLAEGETRYELHQDYEEVREGPFFRENNHKGFGLTLLKQHVITDKKGDIDNIVSEVAVMENGRVVIRHPLDDRAPLDYRGIRIYQREAGFAPFVQITGPGHRKLAAAYILLLTGRPEGEARFYLNGLAVPGLPFELNLEFFPDVMQNGREYKTRNPVLHDPAMLVTVKNNAAEEYRKLLRPGQHFAYGGYSVEMGDVRHWNAFEVVNDRGAVLVFAGSGVALAGLALWYLWRYPRRRN